jgi:hypothetical protein
MSLTEDHVLVTYRGRQCYLDELPRLREQYMDYPPVCPPLDLATLPDPAGISLAQLGDRCPQVRQYVTAEGQVRSGLNPADRATAQQILNRYRGPV